MIEQIATFRPIDTDQQVLDELQQQLEKDGYSVKVNDGIFGIVFDPEKLNKIRSRGAGRPRKTTNKTCREMYLYRLENSQKEAAKMLGVSLRTYQRMEKYAKDTGNWNDTQAAAAAWFETN